MTGDEIDPAALVTLGQIALLSAGALGQPMTTKSCRDLLAALLTGPARHLEVFRLRGGYAWPLGPAGSCDALTSGLSGAYSGANSLSLHMLINETTLADVDEGRRLALRRDDAAVMFGIGTLMMQLQPGSVAKTPVPRPAKAPDRNAEAIRAALMAAGLDPLALPAYTNGCPDPSRAVAREALQGITGSAFDRAWRALPKAYKPSA